MNTNEAERLMFLRCHLGYGEVRYLSADRESPCIFDACGVFERIMFILFYECIFTVQYNARGIKDNFFSYY